MAKLVFGMNQSLDGFVDHDRFRPDPVLFRYFVQDTASLTGSLYGRKMYEIMRYWDDEEASWDADERDFAVAWRKQPKWVVSTTLKSVGPNAALLEGDLATAASRLKAEYDGVIEVAGPQLAQGLTDLGLIDEYRLYIHPVVLGSGVRLFAGATPPLRLTDSERIGPNAIRLTYVPA
jgi:dihydrofolate reductase